MSSANEYIEKYKQYDIEQLRAFITDGASVESLELAVGPWRVTRESLESVNDGTRRAVERLKAGWQSESADEFERRVGLICDFTNDLSIYFDYIEKEALPLLASYLKEAQDGAAEITGEASGQSYEEWAASRESHEMDDRQHFEHVQEQERDRMAQIVGTLAFRFAEMDESFKSNPPPTPASPEMPGAHAEAPTGMIPGAPGSGMGAPGSQVPATPASPNAGSSGLPSGPGGVEDTSEAPAAPATENPWGLGDDDDEQVGDGLYASTNGAGLGGGAPTAAAAPAGGGAGVGAMGAGATGMGVAGGTAAAATSGTGAARAGGPGGMRPGATGPAGTQAAAGGGKPGAAAAKGGAAGRAGGVGQGMAGGRPGDDSDEEETKDANWLTETERYFAHFDPKAGPADENDPQCVREWERMYDRWLEMKENGEL